MKKSTYLREFGSKWIRYFTFQSAPYFDDILRKTDKNGLTFVLTTKWVGLFWIFIKNVKACNASKWSYVHTHNVLDYGIKRTFVEKFQIHCTMCKNFFLEEFSYISWSSGNVFGCGSKDWKYEPGASINFFLKDFFYLQSISRQVNLHPLHYFSSKYLFISTQKEKFWNHTTYRNYNYHLSKM